MESLHFEYVATKQQSGVANESAGHGPEKAEAALLGTASVLLPHMVDEL